ncbi:hypothetical protein Tco_1029431 [Tanacetum coccineum]|uniref:Uncharacterized protein n=1 Tax=Tanacetum coccineum TaxID=301880 RepID=A0ABQ5G3D5_9ASTR
MIPKNQVRKVKQGSVGSSVVAKSIRPMVLIGSSRAGQTFTKDVVVEAMASFRISHLKLADGVGLGKKNFGKEDRELNWAQAQRTLHGLDLPEVQYVECNNHNELNQMAEDAKRQAEMTRSSDATQHGCSSVCIVREFL